MISRAESNFHYQSSQSGRGSSFLFQSRQGVGFSRKGLGQGLARKKRQIGVYLNQTMHEEVTQLHDLHNCDIMFFVTLKTAIEWFLHDSILTNINVNLMDVHPRLTWSTPHAI